MLCGVGTNFPIVAITCIQCKASAVNILIVDGNNHGVNSQ